MLPEKDLKTAESASPANLPTHGDIDGYNYVLHAKRYKAGEVLYVFAKIRWWSQNII